MATNNVLRTTQLLVVFLHDWPDRQPRHRVISLGRAAQGTVEDWRQYEAKQRHSDHARKYGDAGGVAKFGACATAANQGPHAQDE